MLIFRLFFILATLFITGFLDAKSIDALLILDMKKDIRESSLQNEALMRQNLQLISQTTNIPLHLTVLKGANASSSNIKAWFLQARTSHPDILLFYFSGHGMKNTKKGTPWPCLYLSHTKRFIDLSEITSLVQSMNSRLSLVLADCCNSAPTFKSVPYQEKAAVSFNRQKCIHGMKKLFTHTRGYVFATAATPGQFGIATERGSMFTLSLTAALVQTSLNRHPSWNDVFNSTASLCSGLNAKYSHILQIPYVDLSVN